MIRIEVWDKEKMRSLTKLEQEMWFDVYNNGLVEDKGYSLDDENINEIKETIKKEYYDFLYQFTRDSKVRLYFILYEEDKIVSVCRVFEKVVLYLEGVETHRDFMQKGYATKLLEYVVSYLKEESYPTLKCKIHKKNTASIRLHEKVGFIRYDELEYEYRYEYQIMDRQRYFMELDPSKQFDLLGLFVGIRYHIDNNMKYYKDAKYFLWTSLIFTLFILDAFFTLLVLNGPLPFNIILYMLFAHLVLFVIMHINHIRRILTVKDETYLFITKQYFKRTTIVLFINSVLLLLINLFFGK